MTRSWPHGARKAHAHPQSFEKTQSGKHAFPLGIHGRRRGRRTFHPRVHGRREGKERKSLFINSSFSATSSMNPWVKRTSSSASSMNSQCKRTSARWAGRRGARERRKVSHRVVVVRSRTDSASSNTNVAKYRTDLVGEKGEGVRGWGKGGGGGGERMSLS